jgi:DNA polymerase elongation subunit (family B)
MSYISALFNKNENEVVVWERNNGVREVKTYPAPLYFYTEAENGNYTSIFGKKLMRHDFDTYAQFSETKRKLTRTTLYESDIMPDIKVLSEHYYNVTPPTPNITLLDIEVDYNPKIGFSSAKNPYAPINAIALHHIHTNRSIVVAIPPPGWDPTTFDTALEELSEIVIVPNERELINILLEEIEDSDILSGWNSDFFDIPYIAKRIEKTLGKSALRRLSFDGANLPRYREVEVFKQQAITCDLSGRVHLDYMNLFRKYEVAERPSYKLESIAEEILPHLPKLEYEGSLAELYKNDFNHFIRYNIRDTEILKGFEQKLGYIALANVMCHTSTSQFKDVFGTLKLSDFAVVNYCHYELDVKVPDWTEKPDGRIQGAYVLLPQIGMHEWIGSIDINSLYPSSIRSINISPETLIGQFTGNISDWEEIVANSDNTITLEYDNGELQEGTASEWRQYLKQKKWVVSGFGTVFDQNKPGIVPTILAKWYKQRKEYQKLKNEYYEKAQLASDETEKEELMEQSAYYDRLQYVFKIKLNSFYGALTNYYFRFFDLRMGESTTGTGRAILRHQVRKTAEILDDEEYDTNFPLYSSVKSAEKDGNDPTYALDGSEFKGIFPAESIIYGDSVSGDSVINTTMKEIEIQTLFTKVDYVRGNKEYCITDLPQVLTYNEELNKTEYSQINYVMRHRCNKKMYRVWITNSQYINVTEDHSLMGYVNSKFRKKYNNAHISKVKPTDLGTEIKTLIYQKTLPQTIIESKELSTEMYVLMGYVLGDGYVDTTDTGGVLLSLGKQDLDEVVSKLIVPLKQQGWLSSYTVKPNVHDIQISGTQLKKFLRRELYSTENKQIPAWMFNETPSNISSFMKGWFSADGFVNMNGTVGLCNIDEQLIVGAQKLLFRCGISSTWFSEQTENSYKSTFFGTFTKRLTVKNANDFFNVVGFVQNRKQDKMHLVKNGKRKSEISKYDFELVNVYKIEEIQYCDYVYDIEVDNTHTFFANNILVHNTDSVYFNTHGRDQEEATLIADAVANQVNKSFQGFMQEAFLCNPGYDDIIKCGREVVSDRGIFVDKKRYVLHLVDLDGHHVDKMKIMGLELKKTTLPKPIAKKLSLYVERLLKGESWDVLSRDIVDFKTELNESVDVMSIGLPKGIKGIEEYTAAWKLNEKTRLPGHVAAGIFWNNMLQEYGDKESLSITSNMKIKVFYLKRMFGRFKAIAIPTDLTIIPQWFLEEFEPIIDKKVQIEKLVDETLRKIFVVINLEVPSPQSVFIEEEVEF